LNLLTSIRSFNVYRWYGGLPGLFPKRYETGKTIRKFNCPLAFAPPIAPLYLE